MSLLEKMRGDRRGWYKVSDLRPGVEIATPAERPSADFDGSVEPSGILWDEIVSITPVGREHVYDIEVEGTHNFVGNGIFAHNTYVLRANTMLAVTGEVNAGQFVVPVVSTENFTVGTTTLMAEIPSAVLTADGKGVDLYRLSAYNLAAVNVLATRLNDDDVRVTSLESRVEKLETGAIASVSGSPISIASTSLASAFNAFGAFISKGIAQFGTLIADRFVAATNSAGTSSAGTGSVLAGNTVAQVTNEYVAISTKVFVTFNSQITGSWWVSDKTNGSFRVVLSSPQTSDVSFDYFLVQTEGQIATSTPNTVVQHSVLDTSGGFGTDTTSSPVTSTTTSIPVATTTTPTSTPISTDTTPPVVTLNGAAALQITVGDAFADQGATATDDTDGDLTAKIVETGAVDATIAGLYTLTYSATDAAGNVGSVSRVVTVVAPIAPAPTPAPTTTTTTTTTTAP